VDKLERENAEQASAMARLTAESAHLSKELQRTMLAAMERHSKAVAASRARASPGRLLVDISDAVVGVMVRAAAAADDLQTVQGFAENLPQCLAADVEAERLLQAAAAEQAAAMQVLHAAEAPSQQLQEELAVQRAQLHRLAGLKEATGLAVTASVAALREGSAGAMAGLTAIAAAAQLMQETIEGAGGSAVAATTAMEGVCGQQQEMDAEVSNHQVAAQEAAGQSDEEVTAGMRHRPP